MVYVSDLKSGELEAGQVENAGASGTDTDEKGSLEPGPAEVKA
jgi:hypothetical protein